jgi:phosphinothricin acetyltransferase
VIIRPAVEDDLERITEIYNYYVLNNHATFDVEPRTPEKSLAWFSHYSSNGPYRLLIADDDGTVCGFASSSPFRERAAYATSVETSVYCDPAFVGRGVGSALYGRLFDEIAGEDLHRAYGGIALPNAASIRLHERFGFTKIGEYHEVGRKFGRFWDVAWYEKPLG